MKKKLLFGAVSLWLLCAIQACSAPQKPPLATEILSWSEGTVSPRATLKIARWLEGSWQGALEGNMQQHVVLPPVSGRMPGFALGWTNDGVMLFYEINVFEEVEGSIEFRVKHLSPGLSAWEGQDGFIRHRLVAYTDEALFFDGITFVRNGPDAHTVYYRFPEGERKGQVIVVNQKRIR